MLLSCDVFATTFKQAQKLLSNTCMKFRYRTFQFGKWLLPETKDYT